MERKRKKNITIYRLFLKYLIGLTGTIIALILLLVLSVSAGLQSGILLPANFSAVRLSEMEQTLQEAFHPASLPPYCSYMMLDKDGAMLESSMDDKERTKAKAYLLYGKRSYYTFYKILSQPNQNTLVIQYDLLAHFRNPLLHQLIPRPEIFLFFLLLSLIVLSTGITASRFSRKLKQNLRAIVIATEKIKNQDLDFEVSQTEISDLNTVLDTITQLKSALSTSLKEQWDMEQQKKFQLSALTHDIKTPLTIIKGNAELLLEGNPCEEEKELLSYIQSGSCTIENYLKLLMEAVNGNALQVRKREISLAGFVGDLVSRATVLCKTKNIEFQQRNLVTCPTIYADTVLLGRAIINIIDNAVCYSSPGSLITFSVYENETAIIFNVIDAGKGFSENGLKKATQEFFTEDTSRTNHHYGLGLSFAKAVSEMHNGSLTLKNDDRTKGANVSIKISKSPAQAVRLPHT